MRTLLLFRQGRANHPRPVGEAELFTGPYTMVAIENVTVLVVLHRYEDAVFGNIGFEGRILLWCERRHELISGHSLSSTCRDFGEERREVLTGTIRLTVR
jgi:hypothetical protein